MSQVEHTENSEIENEESGATTITIGPGILLLFLGATIALVAGFYVARGLREEPVQTTQAQAPQAAPPVVIESSVSGDYAGAGDPSERSPGTVFDLPSNHPIVGQPYIDIAGTTLDGEAKALSDYVGQPVMLNFWATWCPPCRVEMPWMQEAYETYSDQGFEILAVDAGERVAPDLVISTVQTFVQGMGLTFPVMLPDDPYGSQVEYRVYGLPSTYMIGPDGTVIDAHRGMYPNRATLIDRVRQLVEASAEAGDAGASGEGG